jgi:hypothetical protein
MMLIWTVAWSIFAANPVAAYTAERIAVRTAAEQSHIDARLAASKAAIAVFGRGL